MKISETTSYPHPVLAPWSTDITGAAIQTTISFQEDRDGSAVSIHCAVEITHPEISQLIAAGLANFGLYIECKETGLRRVQKLGFPAGTHQFAPGALLGRVQLRPMVWATGSLPNYKPAGAHPEFGSGCDITCGELLALDDEQVIEVTRPALPSIESIFEIASSDEVEDGNFDVNAGADRITVQMSERTYQLVQSLRGTDATTRPVIMNALYIPIVMQVLSELAEAGYDQFEQYRWLHPFRARCELAGVDIKKIDLFNDAQRLLHQPFASLGLLVDDPQDRTHG